MTLRKVFCIVARTSCGVSSLAVWNGNDRAKGSLHDGNLIYFLAVQGLALIPETSKRWRLAYGPGSKGDTSGIYI